MTLSELGNGSWILGVLLLVFAFIGLINAVIAFMMWAKAFLETLDRKATSRFWFLFPIIVVSFGWYALIKILSKIL